MNKSFSPAGNVLVMKESDISVTGSGNTDTAKNARCGGFLPPTAQQDVPCLLQTVSGYSFTGMEMIPCRRDIFSGKGISGSGTGHRYRACRETATGFAVCEKKVNVLA
ncbi:hypothetical protein NB636_04020 [Oxalobacter aliiformigenes]|uniref:hypothetical protein n=1 Tax=Oxalobacter aliiformigenes TaxID=2946593 RepID=UPI0022AE8280|nr:hypothetical protein [Oxalobacter aliiformigenes]MCZ4066008.1 hypothetical protein [Oxalobacter aliiformigenes]WAW00018.1 hypothetical protein NB636_04020 [Oxalobacter aliiformigenes]